MRSISLLLAFLAFFAACLAEGAEPTLEPTFKGGSENAAHDHIGIALINAEAIRLVRTARQTSFAEAANDIACNDRRDSASALLAATDHNHHFAAGYFTSFTGRGALSTAHALASPRAPPHAPSPAAV